MKKLLYTVIFVLMTSFIIADTDMIGFGIVSGGIFGMGFLGIINFTIEEFIFSVIF